LVNNYQWGTKKKHTIRLELLQVLLLLLPATGSVAVLVLVPLSLSSDGSVSNDLIEVVRSS
jgi:hypothetical protein